MPGATQGVLDGGQTLLRRYQAAWAVMTFLCLDPAAQWHKAENHQKKALTPCQLPLPLANIQSFMCRVFHVSLDMYQQEVPSTDFSEVLDHCGQET